jgi:hypothetical protein
MRNGKRYEYMPSMDEVMMESKTYWEKSHENGSFSWVQQQKNSCKLLVTGCRRDRRSGGQASNIQIFCHVFIIVKRFFIKLSSFCKNSLYILKKWYSLHKYVNPHVSLLNIHEIKNLCMQWWNTVSMSKFWLVNIGKCKANRLIFLSFERI